MIKQVHVDKVTELVEKLCMDANFDLSKDIVECMKQRRAVEVSPLGKDILGTILENAQIAKTDRAPMCQDTGMTVVFVDIGQDVHVVGGSLEEAINQGVRQGYEKGYLRKSVVKSPLDRKNTGDNTPAIIHYNMVEGEEFKITISPKGFGSENMSQLKMLMPSEGLEGIKKFVIETVSKAGSNPCPPIIVGIGIGGTMEKCAELSKRALLMPLDEKNPDPQLAELEAELLESINALGIGPAGFGGITTALAVNIKTYATHIAGLPVAVNIGCHANRHAEGNL